MANNRGTRELLNTLLKHTILKRGNWFTNDGNVYCGLANNPPISGPITLSSFMTSYSTNTLIDQNSHSIMKNRVIESFYYWLRLHKFWQHQHCYSRIPRWIEWWWPSDSSQINQKDWWKWTYLKNRSSKHSFHECIPKVLIRKHGFLP